MSDFRMPDSYYEPPSNCAEDCSYIDDIVSDMQSDIDALMNAIVDLYGSAFITDWIEVVKALPSEMTAKITKLVKERLEEENATNG